jgi:hypothetical protein
MQASFLSRGQEFGHLYWISPGISLEITMSFDAEPDEI